MRWRQILIAILGLAFIVECAFPIGGFFLPEQVLSAFQVTATPETLFLTFVLAWCLLLVTLVCGLALWLVVKQNPSGWLLSYLLGLWWIGIGLALYLCYGKVENLVLDALKGALITISAYKSRPQV